MKDGVCLSASVHVDKDAVIEAVEKGSYVSIERPEGYGHVSIFLSDPATADRIADAFRAVAHAQRAMKNEDTP